MSLQADSLPKHVRDALCGDLNRNASFLSKEKKKRISVTAASGNARVANPGIPA